MEYCNSYCSETDNRIKSASVIVTHKPTILIKSASSYSKQKKLTELGAIIRGTSYPPMNLYLCSKLRELLKLMSKKTRAL